MTQPPADDLVALADKLLTEDGDHMLAEGDDLIWLIAQIAAWPTRVVESNTTNDRFLKLSAARTLRHQAAELTRLRGMCDELAGAVEPFAKVKDFYSQPLTSPEHVRARAIYAKYQEEQGR